MINKSTEDQKTIDAILKKECGASFSFLEKLKYGIYGSPRYQINIDKTILKELTFGQHTNLIYATLEIRKKGICLYFRFKNDEYIDYCRHNQISFLCNDNKFEIQLANNSYSLKILLAKSHKSFLKKLYMARNMQF
ncbi:MAG: hypothetical protein ACON4Y_01300 [Flavobacteriales bacterium]